MLMYNLIEHDNYAKLSGILWQYYRNELFITNDSIINNVLDDPDSASFKSEQKTTGQAGNYGTKDVQVMAPLKS